MAKFREEEVDAGTPGQTVWKRIRAGLVMFPSVEVLATDDPDHPFVLRYWIGERKDGSNARDASPDGDW